MKPYVMLGAFGALAITITPAAIGATKPLKTKTFKATLTGAKEQPGPGDSDGSGTAIITIRGSRLCYDITMKNINGSSQAHIHKGAKEVAGPVVITLFTSQSTATRRKGCLTPPAAKRKQVKKNSGGWYVNVHNSEFPGGAIRGQMTHLKSKKKV
jgi:hypothetical protein